MMHKVVADSAEVHYHRLMTTTKTKRSKKTTRSASEIAADIRANVAAYHSIGHAEFHKRSCALWDEAQSSRSLDEAVCAALAAA